MKQTKLKGFTFVELMVSMVIMVIIMGALIAAFTKIGTSARNASRSSDLDNVAMGLTQLLTRDFSYTGKGLDDLKSLDVHYKFSGNYTSTFSDTEGLDDTRFYGIADIDFDPAVEASTITLQYFDYEFSDASEQNPTFLVLLDAPTDEWDSSGNYDSFRFCSNNDTLLASVLPKDIFIVYKNTVFEDIEDIQEFAIWNAPKELDTEGNPIIDNSAMILQVGEVAATTARLGLDCIQVTFAADDVFDNNLGANAIVTDYKEPNDDLTNLVYDEENDSSLPKGLFLARKLGGEGSHHRVTYVVETDGETKSLVRYHNGRPEVIASHITKFDVYVGMDVPSGILPDDVVRDHMDGFVSVLDNTAWTRGPNDPSNNWAGIGGDDFKKLVGRHGLALRVELTQESLLKDSQSNTGSTDNRKVRSFERLFRLKNSYLPSVNN